MNALKISVGRTQRQCERKSRPDDVKGSRTVGHTWSRPRSLAPKDNPFEFLGVQQNIEAEKEKNTFQKRKNDLDCLCDFPDRMAAVGGWLNRSMDFRATYQSEHHYGATEAMTPDLAACVRQDKLPFEVADCLLDATRRPNHAGRSVAKAHLMKPR